MVGTEQAQGFIALSDVAAQVGLSTRTMRRRVERWGVPLFADPLDMRRTLVRTEDAEELFRPRLIGETGRGVDCVAA